MAAQQGSGERQKPAHTGVKKAAGRGGKGGPKHPGVKDGAKFKGQAGKKHFTKHKKHKPNMKERRKRREAQAAAGGSQSNQIDKKQSSPVEGQKRKEGLKRKHSQIEGSQKPKFQGGKGHKAASPNSGAARSSQASANPKVAKLKAQLQKKLGKQPENSEDANLLEAGGPQGEEESAKKQAKKPAIAAISSNWLALSQQLKEQKKAAKKGKSGTQGNNSAANALPRGKAQGSEPGRIVPEGDLKRFEAPIAMDCEMVGVGDDGKRSVLARVSLVDVNGDVVMDTFVAPKEHVTDLRTFVSGVRFRDLKGAPQFGAVQKKVSEITNNKLLVGHALKNDLAALMLSHPKHLIRDTAKYRPFQSANKKARKLQALAAEFLGLDIQSGEHSSVEDARAALLLYKHSQGPWEKDMARKAAVALRGKKQRGAKEE